MPLVRAYHRPDTIDDALALLAEVPERVILGGGTAVNADRSPGDIEVVDLQALGLSGVATDGDRVRIGAATTLHTLSRSDQAPQLLRMLARAEEPSTMRTISTVGGSVASRSWESVLLAGLLVHDAQVELAGAPAQPLADLLAGGVPTGAIITAVTVQAGGETAHAATGRTPADTPIVAAVGRATEAGVVVALTGVAAAPIVVNPSNPAAGLQPPEDFRGSAAYRTELAAVLSARVVEELS